MNFNDIFPRTTDIEKTTASTEIFISCLLDWMLFLGT